MPVLSVVKPGQTVAFNCLNCGAEGEVLNEPSVVGLKGSQLYGLDARTLKHCPFCGAGDLESCIISVG